MATGRLSEESNRMRVVWRALKTNWIISLVNRFVLFFIIASVILLVIKWQALPPQVPLWYSKPWGEEQLAHPLFLLLLPVSGILTHGLNVLMALVLTHEYLIFTQVLFLSSFLINALAFLTLIKILFLVS